MTQPDLPVTSIVSPRHVIVLPPRRQTSAHRYDAADQPVGRRVTRAPSGTLVAAAVLQAGQALLWMFVGMLMGIGDSGTHSGEPVTVVLVIAAILAFAVGCFALALAAGVFGRSDVCRLASVVFQLVFAVIVLIGSFGVIGGGVGLTVTFDPVTGPAFMISPTVVVLALSSCVAVAVLLTCRPSLTATRTRRRPTYTR
jgi:hypothetical protein